MYVSEKKNTQTPFNIFNTDINPFYKGVLHIVKLCLIKAYTIKSIIPNKTVKIILWS